jgi:hypothetical protein
MRIRSLVALPVMGILSLVCPTQSHAAPQNSFDSVDFVSENANPLIYVGCGNACLFLQNYFGALDFYQKALAADVNDDSENMVLEFLILFGMTVAYDNLHLTDQCQNSLARMKELAQFFDFDNDDDTEKNEDSSDEEIDFFTPIANLSYTEEVRDELLSMITF